MMSILTALTNQAKTGAFNESTIQRAERYLASHPMSEIGPMGQALRNFINAVRAA